MTQRERRVETKERKYGARNDKESERQRERKKIEDYFYSSSFTSPLKVIVIRQPFP